MLEKFWVNDNLTQKYFKMFSTNLKLRAMQNQRQVKVKMSPVKTRNDRFKQTQESSKKRTHVGKDGLQVTQIVNDFKDTFSCDSSRSLSSSTGSSDKAYEVDKVLAIQDDGVHVRYLLKWKDYEYSESTWEDRSALVECTELIDEFKVRDGIIKAIAKMLKKSCKPLLRFGLWRSQAFYACHEWEDQWNRFAQSCGQARVFVENWVDDQIDGSVPQKFKLITFNQLSPEVKPILIKERDKFRKSNGQIFCECRDCMNSKNCCAKIYKMMYGYTPLGRLRRNFNADIDWLIECGTDCKCDKDCPSRVVQRGRQFSIVIFRTKDRGWGVRAAERIDANSFVTEYVGMVRLIKNVGISGPLYTYSMDNCGECMFVVDAAEVGNEARFVNHSCDPNIVALPVIVERFGPTYQRIAFFAKRDIQKGEELTVNYFASDHGNLKKKKSSHPVKNSCLCGASNCCGYIF